MVGACLARQYFCRLIVGLSMTSALVGPAFAQDATDREAEYGALLQEIQNLEMSIAFKRAQLQTQETEIEGLSSQIAGVPALIESINPILQSMSVEIDKQIAADIPFKLTERYDRLAAFQETIAEGSATPPVERMRRALSIYGIEVGYGSNVEAYPGNHPSEDKSGERYKACEADTASAACALDDDMAKAIVNNTPLDEFKRDLLDGDYLRFGRLALVYVQHDGSDAFRYDPVSKKWVGLQGNERLEARRAVRMAKGESAPAVVNAPLYVK